VEVTLQDDGCGTLVPQVRYIDEQDAEGIVFTNVATHSLTVTKTVGGELGDKTKKFDFQIRLFTVSDADGHSEEIPYTDDIKVPDGVDWTPGATAGTYTFRLADGESLTLMDLPYGVTYAITETQLPGYSTTAAVNDGEAETTNAVTQILDGDHVVSYVNTYDGTVETGLSPMGTGLYAVLALLIAVGAFIVLGHRKRRA